MNQLFKTKEGLLLPLSFRWIVSNGLVNFKPWFIFDDLSKGDSARKAFISESVQGRDVLPIAYRQDCDDFAGFEIKHNSILDNVIYFHPSFHYGPNKCIITAEFESLWLFISTVVVADMEDWACEEALDDKIYNSSKA